MIELRIHGRGGQGAVIASKVLASALFYEDKFVQAFPAFGVERRGAPVVAFARVDDKPIRLRTNIYNPDHIVVLDPTLLEQVNVKEGLKEGGWILINTDKDPGDIKNVEGFKIATVDANRIAVTNRLGSPANPIVNTAILGAVAKTLGIVGLKSIEKAILENVPVNQERNANAACEAYNIVKY